MSLFNWLVPQKGRSFAASAHSRHRRASAAVSSPQASARQRRRNQRREQLYALVRESMIRAGMLSTSYQFKALTLDAEGDGFLVLIDLARPDLAMAEAQRLQTEHWLQLQAQRRHAMEVRAVYWRHRPGTLATPAQPLQPPQPPLQPLQARPQTAATEALMDDAVSAWAGLQKAQPAASPQLGQAVTADEVRALQQALRRAWRAGASTTSREPASQRSSHRQSDAAIRPPDPAADPSASDAASAFAPLGPTQYGKL